jgi:hypothetical protein
MRLPAAAILVLMLSPAAYAGCFEDLGQTGCTDQETFSRGDLSLLSCQNLWYVRNSIYDDHGYCFRTRAAQDVFDNSDCYESDASRLRFNRHEQANINRIVQIEKEKGCRAP